LRIIGASAEQSFALGGHTDADARRWLGGRLGAHGLDASALDAKSPYAIPAHAVERGGAYGAGKLSEPLTELAAWFASAQHALGRTHDQMIARKLAPSPVRTWPHHFDTATLTLLEGGSAEHARSVNVGFSPGDENYDEPYFYVSPHPYPDPRRLPALPPLGHWHVRGFTAAIAPASRIIERPDPQAGTEAFPDEAVAVAITVLT